MHFIGTVVCKKLSGLSIYKPGVINELHIQKLNGMQNIIAHMHRIVSMQLRVGECSHFIEHLQPTRCHA